jgi:uncharacterized protein YdaU (DUF1376 family)
MKNDAWYPWFPGDFASSTKHLTLLEKGAYRELLDAYYRRGSLPNDDTELRRMSGMSPPQWRRSRARILEYFDIKNGYPLRHIKADRVIAARDNLSAERSKAGKLGNSKRWKDGRKRRDNTDQPHDDRNCDSFATGLQSRLQSERKKEALQASVLSSDALPSDCAAAGGCPDGPPASAPPTVACEPQKEPDKDPPMLTRTDYLPRHSQLVIDPTPVRESPTRYEPFPETGPDNPPVGAECVARAVGEAYRAVQERARAVAADDDEKAVEARERALAAMGITLLQAQAGLARITRERLAAKFPAVGPQMGVKSVDNVVR